MSDILKITVTFGVILLLLRKKMNIGYVMLISSGILVVLYRMNPADIGQTIRDTVLNRATLTLMLALSLIRIFELILREQQVLSNMMTSVKQYFRSRRALIVSMPLLIGMLPIVGGAYFSAPMVDEATKNLKMSQDDKAFVNYWFRHPWEYILPLYPGVLLASAVSNIPLYNLILANTVYACAVIATGFLFGMRNLRAAPIAKRTGGWHKKDTFSFIPIVAILVLVIAFRIQLHYALILLIVPLFFVYRYPLKEIWRLTRHGFTRDMLLLIFGVMLFKETMEASGAVSNLSRVFIEQGIPILPIFCLLPFLTGILTGLTVGFVGSTFPLLISLGGGASLAALSLAFASGFVGVLLSPVHVCLILTREYFKADLWLVYKKMIPAAVIILIAAFIEYMLITG
jgi:integral membrane protein (TIGR00529 family)